MSRLRDNQALRDQVQALVHDARKYGADVDNFVTSHILDAVEARLTQAGPAAKASAGFCPTCEGPPPDATPPPAGHRGTPGEAMGVGDWCHDCGKFVDLDDEDCCLICGGHNNEERIMPASAPPGSAAPDVVQAREVATALEANLVLANLTIGFQRGMREKAEAHLRLVAGDLAERLALDMDHGNRDHSRWYAAVKKARAFLDAEPAAPPGSAVAGAACACGTPPPYGCPGCGAMCCNQLDSYGRPAAPPDSAAKGPE